MFSATEIAAAKAEGFDLGQEIIAQEGFEWANDYFNRSAVPTSPSWFGFQDALMEHVGHYYRDGLMVRGY